MNERIPEPCEHCKATGLFQGAACERCRGKGYHLIVSGVRTTTQAAEPARRRWKPSNG